MSNPVILTNEEDTGNNLGVDEINVEYYEKIALHRIIRKLDKRLLTFLPFLEFGSYTIRTGIGHAMLMDMSKDLKLTPWESKWSTSLFFLFYLIFEIPSIILLHYLKSRRYLPLSMLVWGGLTVGTAFVINAGGLLSIRCLLGIAQSGFFPGIVIYFSYWYPKRYHTMRIVILFGAAILASALNSILAYGFRYMNGLCGLKSWQWMFLLEGLPMIPLAIISGIFLQNVPEAVQWLEHVEKSLLTNAHKKDKPMISDDNTKFSRQQVQRVFSDRHMYLYALIIMGNVGVIKYLTTSLPMYVKDMGFTGSEVHLMSAPPYVAALICCLLIGYSSSRLNEHGFHAVFALSLALVGFILMVVLIDRGQVALYVGACISCCGLFSSFPVLLSWITINIDGFTKKAIAVGFVMGVGQFGGIILPLIDDDEKTNRRLNLTCLGILIVSLILTLILRLSLWLENRRRDNLLIYNRNKYDQEASIEEPCDWHPDVRYVL